jgi:hypothetical protein
MGMPDGHLERCAGRTGGDRGKDTRLALGDLWACLGEADCADGNGTGNVQRSQQRPQQSADLTRGRIFYGKEQMGILDGCGATARHVEAAEPL